LHQERQGLEIIKMKNQCYYKLSRKIHLTDYDNKEYDDNNNYKNPHLNKRKIILNNEN